MELSRSSGLQMGMWGRVRQVLFMQLPGSPNPPPETPGTRVFRAWHYWEKNVQGLPFVVASVLGLFVLLGGILLWQSRGWQGRVWGAGLILFAIAAVWCLVAGNLGAMYPYAVEIEDGKGFRFYAPFKQFYIPTQEVKRVRWSWLWFGWVVRLRQRRGLLSGFVIHRAWGQQGRELAEAIGEELSQSG